MSGRPSGGVGTGVGVSMGGWSGARPRAEVAAIGAGDRSGGITGFLEVVQPLQVRGWAIDSHARGRRLHVTATIGAEFLAFGVADITRNDLCEIGTDDGRHGFVLNLARTLAPDELARVSVDVDDEAGRPVALRRLAALPPPAAGAVPAAGVGAPPPPGPGPAAPVATFRRARSDASHRPLFILGAARSGTSALAQSLLSSTRYEGPEEGHLLDLVLPLAECVRAFFRRRGEEWSTRRTLIAAVGEEFVQDWSRQVFLDAARQLFPNGVWLDKTPRVSMITAAPVLRSIWPNARFVYIKRRGLENVASRLRKFPTIDFRSHCVDWASSLQEWRRIHPLLAGAALELDQLFVAREPATAAQHLAEFLDLNAEERRQLEQSLTHERPERTSESFASTLSLAGTGWDGEQQHVFRTECGEMMRAYGYSEGSGYVEPDSPYSSVRRL